MKKFIRDCFTGVDNSTWDFMRVGIAAGAAMMVIGMLTIIAHGVLAFSSGVFNYAGFSAGMTTMAAGLASIFGIGGAALWAKRSTEPQAAMTSQTDARGNTTTQMVATGLPVIGDEK